jgi:hypothetical protein
MLRIAGMSASKVASASTKFAKTGCAVLGALLLLAAAWLVPVNPGKDWSDSRWEKHLLGSEWLFTRYDGTVITRNLGLSFFGSIKYQVSRGAA